jgi:hypothetical protein
MVKILCALPSNRPEQLAPMLASLHETAKGKSFRVVVGCDAGDKETQRVVRAYDGDVFVCPDCLYRIPGVDHPHPFNQTRCVNFIAESYPWDLLWVMNDDLRVATKGWDKLISKTPDGYLGFTRTNQDPDCVTDFPVFTRRHFDAHGHIWPECFAGWGADRWMGLVYYMAKRHYPTGVFVTHQQADMERMKEIYQNFIAAGQTMPDIREYGDKIFGDGNISKQLAADLPNMSEYFKEKNDQSNNDGDYGYKTIDPHEKIALD